MARVRTSEDIRRLKERGLVDVGTSYLPLTGAERVLRRTSNWTGEDGAEAIPYKRTPEQIRALRARGIIDVGTSYLPLTGAERVLSRRRNWTDEDEDV